MMSRQMVRPLTKTLALGAFLVIFNLPLAHALFPPPGGGGGAPTGVIYYTDGGLMWFMNPDGTNKTSLPAGVNGEPSRGMHAGRRWPCR